MDVGLMFSHRNPPQAGKSWHRVYAETLEQVEVAEQLGFDAVLTTEHHFVEDGYSPGLMPIEAAWAARTRRVRIGSLVLLLSMQNPLRLAEDAATVDIISNGRLFLGLGLGYRQQEFDTFGLPRDRWGVIMDEALEVLIRAFTEDDWSLDGRWFKFKNVRMRPKSIQQPRPPIWLGSPSGRPGVRRVAQWGLEGFCGSPPAELWEYYVSKCRQFGTEPRAETQALVFGHCAEDPERAWAEARPYAEHVHGQYVQWQREAGHEHVFPGTPRDDFIFGDPAYWIERIERTLAAQSGGRRPTTLVVQLQLAGMPHETVLRSMELFAAKVLPYLHERA